MNTAPLILQPRANVTLEVPQAVTLIIPPSPFLLDERVFMHLGILRIAAVLEQAGTTVEVLDLSGIKNYLDALRDHVRHTRSTIFGITATTPQLPASVLICEVIREVARSHRVILGGPHVTLVNAGLKGEIKRGVTNGRAAIEMEKLRRQFDVLVAGDGETSIFHACAPNAVGVIDADDRKSNLFLSDAMLNELPWPARHLVDVDSYKYSIGGVRALSVIAQLGCPFSCGFCGGRESAMLRVIRTRTTENIVAEMEHLYTTYGVSGFMFYDDELNVNKKIVELMDKITEAQMRLGASWRLRGFVKSELFTDAQAKSMYAAGFRQLLVGFESGSPRILRNIEKRATRDDNTRAMEIATRHNLKVKALMSIGHPGESEQTVEETRRRLLEVKPDDFDATIITCYPGTPYYDQAVPAPGKPGVWMYTHKASGDVLFQMPVDYSTTPDYYKGDPDGGYTAYVFTETLSAARLVELRDDVESSVRAELNIPFNPGAPGILYEHSMGQSGPLPSNILRVSQNNLST